MIFSAKTFLLRIPSLTTAGVEINKESIKSLKENIPGQFSKQGKEKELANVLLKILFTNFFSLSSSLLLHWLQEILIIPLILLLKLPVMIFSHAKLRLTLLCLLSVSHLLFMSSNYLIAFSLYRWKTNKECLLRKERNDCLWLPLSLILSTKWSVELKLKVSCSHDTRDKRERKRKREDFLPGLTSKRTDWLMILVVTIVIASVTFSWKKNQKQEQQY